MLSPLLDQLSKNSQGKYTIAKVNIDEFPNLAAAFNVSAIPTLVYFNKGQKVGQKVGIPSPQEILITLENLQKQ
jgi:thioredoxin 1